ncbi:PQQ-binding-like beta-propeller repeat protein [Propionibacteriaceae bacterium G57]|uniref:outer membrane protein assembly factor BamB family protein n=1 Tax=Aestuariimicrobium sp. G57 TaxID=3418485 RepID=UPI003DA71C1F
MPEPPSSGPAWGSPGQGDPQRPPRFTPPDSSDAALTRLRPRAVAPGNPIHPGTPSQPGNPHHQPATAPAAAPAPQINRSRRWPVVALILVAVAASIALSAPSFPRERGANTAAQYVAPGGQLIFLQHDDGARSSLETSRLHGAQLLSEPTLEGMLAVNNLAHRDLSGADWVTESEYKQQPDGSRSTTRSLYELDDRGLVFVAGLVGETAITANPSVIEVPADAAPGTTWTQQTTLTLPTTQHQLAFAREGSIAAAPQLGEGCITLTYRDTTDGETNQSVAHRCPGQGLVGTNTSRRTAATSLAGDVGTTVAPPLALRDLAEADGSLSAGGGLGVVANMQRAPVVVSTGFVYINQLTQQVVAFAPGAPDQPMGLAWVRRPGPVTLHLLGAGDLVVATTSDRRLVAYDHQGYVKWVVASSDVAALPPVQVDQHTMAVLTLDGWLTGFDLRDGRQLWRAPAPTGKAALVVIEVDDRPMVVLGAEKDLIVMDRDRVHLQVSLPSRITQVTRTARGVVVLDESSWLTSVSLSGRVQWTTSQGDCDTVAATAQVIACAGDQALTGLDATTGAKLWQLPMATEDVITDGELFAVVNRDAVEVITTSGTVHRRWPLGVRQGTWEWLVRGPNSLLYVTSSAEFARWGAP